MKNSRLDLFKVLRWIVGGFLILGFSYVLIVNSLLLQTTKGSRLSMILYILSGIVALPIDLSIGKNLISNRIKLAIYLVLMLIATVMY